MDGGTIALWSLRGRCMASFTVRRFVGIAKAAATWRFDDDLITGLEWNGLAARQGDRLA